MTHHLNPLAADELRRIAESRLRERQKTLTSQNGAERTAHATQRLVQELQIHQIELEMQNEQLEQARLDTSTALELYTDLYEFAPAGYFTLDRDGVVCQVNLTGSKLLGVDRSRLVKARFGSFVAQKCQTIFSSFLSRVFASQSSHTCEAMLLKEGGYPFYARIEATNSGNDQACRAVVVDITEQKAAENKIQEQANLLDLAHDAISVRDLNEKIQYWNKGAEQLYGWATKEAIGGNFAKMVYKDRASFDAARKILLREGCWEGELRKLTKAGSEVAVACRWTLLKDHQGAPCSILAIDTDVTEKRQMEAQLRTQRLEIIGTLAGGIAHDLNNILQVIITNLDLMGATVPFEGQGLQYLDDATKGAKRATGLARRLLTFSKGGAPVKQPLDIEEIITQAVHLALSGSKLKPRFAFQRDLYPVFGDPVQLTQVIENVVINALEATPAGGRLLVHAQNIEEKTPASVDLPPGRYIRIQIQDSGIGIPKDIRDQVFDICFSTKPDGTGLGLATVKSIMDQHGGTITIDSLVDCGTTVSLLLPASWHQPEPPVAQKSSPMVEITGRILIIDDEEMILSVISSMLRTLGCQAESAQDGVDGLEKYRQAKEEGNPFSAVLLDGTIPNGVAGEEALRLLLDADPQARVILCSGYADSDLFKNAEELGFKAVLPKPFGISDFISVLNKATLPNK